MCLSLTLFLSFTVSVRASGSDDAISGDLNWMLDSLFDDNDEFLSLLQSDVSLKFSVAVKANGDLLSEALPDVSGDDEMLLLQTVTHPSGPLQRAVESVGGTEPVSDAWHPIPVSGAAHTDEIDLAVLERRPKQDFAAESFSLTPHSEGTLGSRFHLTSATRPEHFAMVDGIW
uniref:Uncharacterized protein n=1 Tax=Noctiluca scintillans TaxID=2966 RepID=A0A7S0ZQX2_NOCSC|mmetsp:Transcript_1515/g.4159  ORF Transcript_1515/g.4159 Transcript_1515/m.4159 type:complete len:173 (+) Transcript_1515:73-591(+)